MIKKLNWEQVDLDTKGGNKNPRIPLDKLKEYDRQRSPTLENMEERIKNLENLMRSLIPKKHQETRDIKIIDLKTEKNDQ